MNNNIIPFYKTCGKYIVKSKGCYVYDSDGKEYIDFESGDWAANLGHSNERINEVIKNQVENLIHDGTFFLNRESEMLSGMLLEKLDFPSGKSVFLNSGSEAVNLGITIAKAVTKKRKILKIENTFLGSYGQGKPTDENNLVLSISCDDLEALSLTSFEDVSAFVFEPGNHWGLIKFPSVEFIDAITKKIKTSGGLVVVNEVTTGFGRTGKWFGFQHYNLHPDIVSTGKALGNGYPVSGVSVSKEVAAELEKNMFRYVQSHQNDPLGCAVGIEVIKQFDELNAIRNAFETGNYFIENLKEIQQKNSEKIKEIRGRGLMIAMEFRNSADAVKLNNSLFENGFITGFKENVIRFMPPLIINKPETDKLTEVIGELIKIYT